MVAMVPEECWTETVEVIGWLYQYYINEPKDELINAKKQYKNDDVPFVTQIFTSDWIVKYMVQNSLGRSWIETSGKDYREYNWEYYLAADIAYHWNKFSRGFDRVINLWGADHHGYIARMKAAVGALGYDPEQAGSFDPADGQSVPQR